MWSFFSEARVRWLSVFWSALIIGGLFAAVWVRVLSSIGIAGLFLTGLGYALNYRRVAQRARWPVLLSFGLVYVVHAATGLLRNPLGSPTLWQDLLLQLPFVLLPVAFLLLPTWRLAQLRWLWLLLLGCCLAAGAASTINYLLHQQYIEQLYLESRVMPTSPDHIRFSLLISMAVLAGLVLLSEDTALPRALRRATLGAVLLLFLFQHLLAVRSGLVTMYGAGVLWLGWLVWQHRRWRTGLQIAVLAGVLGGACLLLFPTLQNKITNTRTDAALLSSARNANNYSNTGRYYSYLVAQAVIRQHPLLGVSRPQLPAAMAAQYSHLYPEIELAHYLLPHNQFLFNLASYGVLGLVVFAFGFYYPLWRGLRARNILLLLMYAIVTVSFLVEYTLETQIGVVTGLFFLLLAEAPVVPAPKSTAPA